MNGKRIPSLAGLQDLLATFNPGQQVEVTYLTAGGSSHTVEVTLGQLR